MRPYDTMLQRFHGGMVLDVATGHAHFLLSIREILLPNSVYVGVDLRKEGFPPQDNVHSTAMLSFAQMAASALAFPRASFDLVLISNALHHLAEPEESIQEMMRVLKPGGLFMLREMYRDLQQGARRVHVDVHHWWACVDQLRGIPHFQTYTRRELIEITEKLGLSDVVIMDIDENDSLSNDPGTIQAIEQKINESIEWLRENSDTRDLIQQGENLKERLHGEGFFSATKLLAAGIKPEDTNPAAEDPGPGC